MSRRGWLLWGGLVAVLVAVLATVSLLTPRTNSHTLDPQNPQPDGTRAVAEVLGQNGIHVHTIRSVSALTAAQPGSGSTVVIARPDALSDAAAARVRSAVTDAAQLVLLGPSPQAARRLGVDVTEVANRSGAPTCTIPYARGLKPAIAGIYYSAAGSLSCYGTANGAPLLETETGEGPRATVIGASAPFTNGSVTTADNAALVLRMLGQHPSVVWFAQPPTTSTDSAASPWPRWLGSCVFVLVFSGILLVLWRGRRLGALVHEKLPVVVPANETTQSRAILYRRAADHAHSARILRTAAAIRLRSYLALPRNGSDEELVDRLAAVTGDAPTDVHAVLFGTSPRNDHELATLTTELNDLERKARQS